MKEEIRLKQHLTKEDVQEAKDLERICYTHDQTNLKLELDFKFEMQAITEMSLKEINEFYYYSDDRLVAYLGISSFGGSNIGEINGMTHPEYRRKGLFSKLLELARNECQKRNFSKILLLTDGHSNSGVQFIQSVCSEYDFSEYRMKCLMKGSLEPCNSIYLRKERVEDGKEIARQNALFFQIPEEAVTNPEEEEHLNKVTYMVELQGTIVGKISVAYEKNNYAYISGVGILPQYRGNGYGRGALVEALRLIKEKSVEVVELDVECKNDTALQLYKSCGFEEVSVVNYYRWLL